MNGPAKRGSRVEISGVAKSFVSGVAALQPTDLTIAAGEVLVLLGPSGCGKTTLLRLLAGLERPDGGGTILFDGEDVTGIPVEHRQVGMVFQSYALFPNMNVAENVGYGLKVRKVARAERDAEVARLLDTVGLVEFADRRIDRISGGQRQRVALARALAIKPRVLLLDEPLSALDAALRERLRVEISTLLRTFGITAVYVTHDQAEAMAIGDRVAVLERGRIAQIGTPEEVYGRPASRFVAEFVGTSNRITGPVVEGILRVGIWHLPVGGPDRTATIWFRPEAASVAESGTPEGEALAGHVIGSTFLGASCRLAISIGGEQAPILVDVPAAMRRPIGAPVQVRVAQSALVEYPDGPPPC
ncbi:ABC transporter ATP-binding protein [uncultured Enterovirga sp.]|uniref:ABC transporter ATP-binding protein n=1 Tax=uncultured Enterovirga sp. TaxID=2026352 RepID=UPI0035CA9797